MDSTGQGGELREDDVDETIMIMSEKLSNSFKSLEKEIERKVGLLDI